MPDAMWMTALGFALPLIGADTDVVKRAGFDAVPEAYGCGTGRSEWQREHLLRLFMSGFSSADEGDLTIAITTVDGVVASIVVVSATRPIDGALATEALCRGDVAWRNELGVGVE